MSETTAKRTAGRLRYGRTEPITGVTVTNGFWLQPVAKGDDIAEVYVSACRTVEEAEADAAHLAACWNAVEEHAGGDASNVAALHLALADALSFYDSCRAEDGDIVPAWLFSARAILARVRGGVPR